MMKVRKLRLKLKEYLNKSNIKYCEEVANKSGQDLIKTKDNMTRAQKKLGVSFKDYCENDFYKMSFDEQKEAYEIIAEEREKRKEERARQREYVISLVMEETGWTHDFALKKMKGAKRRAGISFNNYYIYNFHEVPKNRQKNAWQEILNKGKEERESTLIHHKVKAEREEYIEKIMQITGWSREVTENRLRAARKNTGCTYKEYYTYGFFNLKEEEQKQMALIACSQKLSEKYNVNRLFLSLIQNKEKSNRYFEKWLGRNWCVNKKVTFEEFKNIFKHTDKVVYKPLKGNRGIGVEVFDISEDRIKSIYDEIAILPEGVVEEYIVQNKDMLKMSPKSVNTIRITTISQNVSENKKESLQVSFLYAALRIGDGVSVVDNFHSGGMTAAIDLKSGEVITNAANLERGVFEKHPATGVQIKGFKVPLFDQAIEMVKEIISEKEVEGYIGWDVAVTEQRPVLVEVNSYPGVVLLQTPYSHEKKGMKYVFDRFL